MNLLSRRSVLAIAAVVDVALHSRSAPVAAKALAARHKLPPRHLETLLQGLVHAKILKGVRGPRGGYELARERRRITVGEIVRTAMSLSTADPEDLCANSILLERVIDPAVRKAGETFSPISIRSPSNRCARRPRKPMCSTTRRSAASSRSDFVFVSLAPAAWAIGSRRRRSQHQKGLAAGRGGLSPRQRVILLRNPGDGFEPRRVEETIREE